MRAERLVQNQILRRAFNESIAEVAAGFDDEREPATFEFVCECNDRTCNTMVPMTTAEYDAVRASGHAFVVVPGHEVESVEDVVLVHSSYLVVAKVHPEPTRLALETDPRRR